MKHRISEAAQRIGGPYSVTWFAFWVTLTLNVLHHFVGSADLDGYFLTRLVGVVLSQVALFGVLLIAKRTVLRYTAQRPRPVVTLVCFALAGVARSAVLLAVLSSQVDLTWSQVAQRLFNGPIPFTVYLAVCAYLVDLYQQNKRTLGESARYQALLVAAREQAEEELTSQGREAVDEVRAELAAGLDATCSIGMTPQRLDAFIDDTVRPMSHRLAARVQRWSPPVTPPVNPALSVRRSLASIGLDRPFSPGVQATLSLAPAVGLVAVLPFWRFVLAMLVTFVTPWIMLTLGNWVMRRLTPHMSVARRASSVAGWTLLTAIVVACAWGVFMLGTAFSGAAIAYGVFVTLVLAAATVAAKAALVAQSSLESELAQSHRQLQWEVTRLHQVQWREQQQLARALHGPVASAVLSEAASCSGHDVETLRQRLIEALETALSVSATPPSLKCLLEGLQRSWRLACEVSATIEPGAEEAAADDLAIGCLSDLLSEALSNAVRHGDARRVAIAIKAEPDALKVTVTDDGAEVSAGSGEGLGTRMLDDCCLAWGIHRTATGARLWFLLPVVFGQRSQDAEHAVGKQQVG